MRSRIPGLGLTTDVIVGFPGESDREFAESLDFVERTAFARPHVFTFSPRAGTHAETLPDPVPHGVKKERTAAMRRVAKASERAFWRSCLGETVAVVWEAGKDGRATGLSDNYIRVFCDLDGDLQGELGHCRLERLGPDGVEVRPILDPDPELESPSGIRGAVGAGASALRILS